MFDIVLHIQTSKQMIEKAPWVSVPADDTECDTLLLVKIFVSRSSIIWKDMFMLTKYFCYKKHFGYQSLLMTPKDGTNFDHL